MEVGFYRLKNVKSLKWLCIHYKQEAHAVKVSKCEKDHDLYEKGSNAKIFGSLGTGHHDLT